MNHFKSMLKLLLPLVLATQITACSKTVQWEEEVPLNTGETIWVKRTDFYAKGGEPGNPLQMAWGLEKRAYEFTWQGKKYSYQIARKTGGPILLYAFVNEKTVSIVDSGWPHCSGYAEFRWINGNWQLQTNVSPELVGQPRNLMKYASADDGAIPVRVTQDFIRDSRFDLPQRGNAESHLLASKIATNCSGKN